MRPTGRANVNSRYPRAHAICDRCGLRFNHDNLSWDYQWAGPRLQNRRFLVCDSCLDVPQEGLRTIVIPPDPAPIMNARPDDYVNADNPMSAIGASPNFSRDYQIYGTRFGNLTGGGGLNAAFDGNPYKQAWQCANNTLSNSSYNNYVGINWGGLVTNLSMPSSHKPPVIRHSLLSFTAYAPSDRSFLGTTTTSYVVQGSHVATAPWGAWTTLSSGTTTGTAGETISGNLTGGNYQFHRIAFLGDQLNFVAIAGVKFNVAQTDGIATTGSS